MKTITNAQIHRFRNHVAMYLQNGETVYLDRDQAQMMAEALSRAVHDIDTREFVDSTFGTWTLQK